MIDEVELERILRENEQLKGENLLLKRQIEDDFMFLWKEYGTDRAAVVIFYQGALDR